MAKEVTDPDGLVWTVRRRWDPRDREASMWARVKDGLGTGLDGFEGLDVAAEIPVVGVIALVAIVVLLVVFVVLPLLLVLLDVLVLIVIVAVAVAGRLLFGRPWIIEARSGEDRWSAHRWEVVGWRASGDHAALVRQQLSDGLPLPEALPPGP